MRFGLNSAGVLRLSCVAQGRRGSFVQIAGVKFVGPEVLFDVAIRSCIEKLFVASTVDKQGPVDFSIVTHLVS